MAPPPKRARDATRAPRAAAASPKRQRAPRCKGAALGPQASAPAVVIAVDTTALGGGATADALHGASGALPNGGFTLARDVLPAQTTHLVRADSPALTLLTIGALARGVHIVTPAWVFESLAASDWLPETAFCCAALGPAPALSVQKRRAGWGGALASTSVCFYGETLLPEATLAALVRSAGGRVEKSHRLADVLVSDAPQPQPRAGAAGAGGAGRTPREVNGSKWLLDRIVHAAAEPLGAAGPSATEAAAGQQTPPPPASLGVQRSAEQTRRGERRCAAGRARAGRFPKGEEPREGTACLARAQPCGGDGAGPSDSASDEF